MADEMGDTLKIPVWMFKFSAWLLGGVGAAGVGILIFLIQINVRLAIIEKDVKATAFLQQRIQQLSDRTVKLESEIQFLKRESK